MPIMRWISGYSRKIQVIWRSQRLTYYDHTHTQICSLGYNTSVHTCVMVVLIFIILGMNTGRRTSSLNLLTKGVITVIEFLNNSILVRKITFDSYITTSNVNIYPCIWRLYFTISKVWISLVITKITYSYINTR